MRRLRTRCRRRRSRDISGWVFTSPRRSCALMEAGSTRRRRREERRFRSVSLGALACPVGMRRRRQTRRRKVRLVARSAGAFVVTTRVARSRLLGNSLVTFRPCVALASDMSVARDETASIRSSVSRASEALGADAASIFLLSPTARAFTVRSSAGIGPARASSQRSRTGLASRAQSCANEASYVTAETAQLAEERTPSTGRAPSSERRSPPRCRGVRTRPLVVTLMAGASA